MAQPVVAVAMPLNMVPMAQPAGGDMVPMAQPAGGMDILAAVPGVYIKQKVTLSYIILSSFADHSIGGNAGGCHQHRDGEQVQNQGVLSCNTHRWS